MIHLIKAELYKLKKSLGFKLIFLGTIIYALIEVAFGVMGFYGEITGFEAFFSSMGAWGRCYLISGIFAGLFIAGDFSNRGIQTEIAVGNSRLNVILSKGFVYWLGCMGLIITYQLINVIGITINKGFGVNMTKEVILCFLQLEFSYLIIFSGLITFCIFIAFLFRHIYVVTALEIVIIMFGTQLLSSLAQINTVFNKIYQYNLLYRINQLTFFIYEEVRYDTYTIMLEMMEPNKVIAAFKVQWGSGMWGEIGISVITSVIFFGITYLVFKKAELK